jgi:hypothetical protein
LIAAPLLNRSLTVFAQAADAIQGNVWAAALVGIVGTFCVILTQLPQRTGRTALIVIILAGVIQVASFSEPSHRRVFANPSEKREFGVYRAATEMMKTFSAFARPDAQVLLWYHRSDPSIELIKRIDRARDAELKDEISRLRDDISKGSIASTVTLHQLHFPWRGPGMPAFGDYERAQLRNPNIRYLMMLSERSDDLEAGRKALQQNGYVLQDVTSRTIGSDGYQVYLQLIEIMNLSRPTEGMLARAVSLPLDQMVQASSASSLQLRREDGNLIGRSQPMPWTYIGRLDLGASCVAGGGWVAVDLRVNSGAIGIGLLNRAGDNFLVRRFITPSKNFQSVYLPVESYREAGRFIVQNGETGVSSEVELRSVQLTKNEPDAPSDCLPGTEPR